MSYCRFSDDNWKSDVYIYESADGYVCHVAGNRVAGDVPKLPAGASVWVDVFLAANNEQIKYLATAERVTIGGIYDGETRVFETLNQLLDFTGELIAEGYHVPAWAIDVISEDIAETAVETYGSESE